MILDKRKKEAIVAYLNRFVQMEDAKIAMASEEASKKGFGFSPYNIELFGISERQRWERDRVKIMAVIRAIKERGAIR